MPRRSMSFHGLTGHMRGRAGPTAAPGNHMASDHPAPGGNIRPIRRSMSHNDIGTDDPDDIWAEFNEHAKYHGGDYLWDVRPEIPKEKTEGAEPAKEEVNVPEPPKGWPRTAKLQELWKRHHTDRSEIREKLGLTDEDKNGLVALGVQENTFLKDYFGIKKAFTKNIGKKLDDDSHSARALNRALTGQGAKKSRGEKMLDDLRREIGQQTGGNLESLVIVGHLNRYQGGHRLAAESQKLNGVDAEYLAEALQDCKNVKTITVFSCNSDEYARLLGQELHSRGVDADIWATDRIEHFPPNPKSLYHKQNGPQGLFYACDENATDPEHEANAIENPANRCEPIKGHFRLVRPKGTVSDGEEDSQGSENGKEEESD